MRIQEIPIENLDRITHLIAALHTEMRPLESSLPPVKEIIDSHIIYLKS
jgi:hypothetical protein